MADGEQGVAPVAGSGDGGSQGRAPVLGADAGGGTPRPKLPDLTGDTWRLHVAGGDADLAKRFDRFTDPSALGKSLIEMEKRWSDPRTARLPQPLPDNATDEQKAAHAKERRDFYSKLGVPEAGDKYDIKIPDDAPDTVKQGVELIRASGVDLGITNEAANGLASKLVEWQTQTDAAFEAAAVELEAANIATLKGKWGADYDTNLKLANAAGAQFFGDGFKDVMEAQLADGTRLGAHPAIVQALAGIAREFQGDPLFSKIASGGADAGSVQTQIDAINALRDGTRQGNAAYDAKQPELLKLIDLKRRLTAA